MYRFPFEKKNISLKKTAIILNENIQLTYSELLLKVSDISNLITSRSICLIKASNDLESLLIYLACLKKKSIAIIIDNNTRESSFLEIINNFSPSYIFFNKNNLNNILYKKIYNKFLDNFYEIKKKVNKKIDKDIALLISTSGSTGSVKFAKLSYENLRSNTLNIIDYLKVSQEDCTISNLPMYYSYGLSIINTHIYSGAKIILTNKGLIDKKLINLIKQYPITNFNGVPFTYEILFKFKLQKYYLSKLSFLTQAGGKIKKEYFDKIINTLGKANTKFFIMYGQTEASPRMSYYLVKNKTFKNGVIGKAIKGGKFYLLNHHNKIISKPNTIGRLIYEGPNIFLGYANNYLDMKNNQSSLRSLDTGDLAKFNTKNQYILVSRDSRFVKIEDKRINLDDIELKFQQNGLDVLCTAENHIYIWHTYKNIDIEKIYIVIKENFLITKRSIQIKYINSFPKNSSGKILYKELYDQ
ncbi:AMP-binding protein [Alphaproteobacteria bacterium]|nr:AMP-binding protein [Alphaproteobacteria bacterium]